MICCREVSVQAKKFKKLIETLTVSRPDQGATEALSKPEDSLESIRTELGPSLDFEGDGNGYVRFEVVDDSEDPFSNPEKTPEYLDNLTDENLVVDPGTSAEVLEHYFGQYSHNVELREHLEYIDEAVLEEENLEGLDSSMVLQLDITDYDGQQHIYRHEGMISEETVEFLAEDSKWSPHTYFLEEKDILFIPGNL